MLLLIVSRSTKYFLGLLEEMWNSLVVFGWTIKEVERES